VATGRLATGSLVLLLRVRLFRACGTSAVSGPTQLGVYLLLRHLAWPPPAANAGALLVATQVSFILSCAVIWPDRGGAWTKILRRWVAFQGSAGATSVLNLLVFVALLKTLPDLPAVCVASGVGAIVCYVLNDRLIFRATTRRPKGHHG
jgi:putative flippase GtrA